MLELPLGRLPKLNAPICKFLRYFAIPCKWDFSAYYSERSLISRASFGALI